MSSSEAIWLTSCRACSDGKHLSHALPSGATITILTGIPPQGSSYKAISHVWGEVSPLAVRCKGCNAESQVRLRGNNTFHAMMNIAGASSTVWIDNLSIDQNNHADIATQVAVMGEIYSNASCVSVLLPKDDLQAMGLINALVGYGSFLLDRRRHFDGKSRVEDKVASEISTTIKRFFSTVTTLSEVTQKSKYWSRAWTFQEWALAKDIEISLDGRNQPVLRNVKSKIIDAAILITDYKLRLGQYAEFEVGFPRGLTRSALDGVKKLFPSEERFLAEAERDQSKVRFQSNFPSYGTDQVLGVRLKSTPRTTEEAFNVRLTAMLDAFDGGANRQATFEADKICCWASMCNIEYGYSKDDSLATAIAKVSRALRKRGLQIFNFHSLCTAAPDVDPQFIAYSFPHPQCNATSSDIIPGVPFLTGRMDTADHLLFSIAVPEEWEIPKPVETVGTTIQEVKGHAFVMSPLHDKNKTMTLFSMATSGGHDKMSLTNVLDHVADKLSQLPPQALRAHVAILASLPISPGSDVRFQGWVVVPLALIQKLYASGWTYMFVGRESLNGTLVVGIRKRVAGDEESTIILGYLAISDNQCGSFLVPLTPGGDISIMLLSPQRGDVVNPGLLPDRALIAKLELQPPLFRETVDEEREYKMVNNNPALKWLGSPRDASREQLDQLVSMLDASRITPS